MVKSQFGVDPEDDDYIDEEQVLEAHEWAY
jgi:hypothetical protein